MIWEQRAAPLIRQTHTFLSFKKPNSLESKTSFKSNTTARREAPGFLYFNTLYPSLLSLFTVRFLEMLLAEAD
jgi:hypothetical protein